MAKGSKNSALDLLGDILAESQAEAEAEEKRLADEAREAKEAERKARIAEEAKLKAEAAERLAKEEQRRLDAEERKRMTELAMQEDDEDDEEVVEEVVAVAAPVEEKTSPVVLLIAALAIGGLAVGGFFGYTEMTKEFVSATSFERVTPAVTDLASLDSTSDVAFVGVPEEEEVEVEAPVRAVPRGGGRTGGSTRTPGLQLGGSSLFGR